MPGYCGCVALAMRLCLMAAVISMSVASHSHRMREMKLEPSLNIPRITKSKKEPLIKIMGSLLSLTREFHTLKSQDAAALGDIKGYCAGGMHALGKGIVASKDSMSRLERRISSLKVGFHILPLTKHVRPFHSFFPSTNSAFLFSLWS